jgi:hypothetical protein
MRVLALAILTIVTVWAAGPVRAQTYGPNYPVCLHVYDLGANYIECAYTSLAQCAMSASGRAAECISIHTLRARKSAGHHPMGGIATPTRYLLIG